MHSDFAIRVEREELSDVVWRMTGMYVFRHFGQDNFRVVPKKNRIYCAIFVHLLFSKLTPFDPVENDISFENKTIF
jgi:hypothetical protein